MKRFSILLDDIYVRIVYMLAYVSVKISNIVYERCVAYQKIF